jgi:hypothetical protein
MNMACKASHTQDPGQDEAWQVSKPHIYIEASASEIRGQETTRQGRREERSSAQSQDHRTTTRVN